MAEPMIRLSSVRKCYGQFVALDDVSLDIPDGEFLALLGPSGCGKTTILKSIAGFTDITDGDILLEGRSIRRTPANRRPVNTVFQNYALFPHLNVLENVAYGPRRSKMSRSQAVDVAERCLSAVGMLDFAGRHPVMLSGGQQQRVALARAIANEPRVLLLDEPLSALDLKLRKQMQMELKNLHEKLGTTFIFVTHDQEEALVMADRIAVMDSGRIAQVGTGKEIYGSPSSRYVADFIGEANLFRCKVEPNGTLRTELGMGLRGTAEPEVGTSLWYLVRPEKIQVELLSDRPSEGAMVARAQVEEVVFIGNAVRIFARTPEGEGFTALSPERHDISRGSFVSLDWDSKHARTLEN